MKNTAMVNGRITSEQMAWLEARAEKLGGNLSAALRQTIADARFLEIARQDFHALRREDPEFKIPQQDDGGDRALGLILGLRPADPEDLELRLQEDAHED